MEKIYIALKKQITQHNIICSKLFKQRYSSDKHEDKWNDELYIDYIRSTSRIDLLIELIE